MSTPAPPAGPPAPPAVVAGRCRPRVVHLTTTDMSLDWLLRPQLEAFLAAGYEVVGVAAPDGHAEAVRASGIEAVPLRNATRAVAPHRDLAALAELWRLLWRLAPDIVHTHNPKPGVYGRIAGRLAGVPAVVNTQHGLFATDDDRWAKRAVVHGLERVAAACSDAELFQNGDDLATMAGLGVPRRRLHLLGNGVDLDRFDPDRWAHRRAAVRAEVGAGPADVVIGVVGRLVWEKGYREVFAAAERLRTRAPAARVVVVGPEDAAKADAVTAEDRRAAERSGVHFLGRRDDVEALYAAMDVYVLASYREGFPRSAMEAAAMGLPVVTTDVRGCREVVVDGVTGRLVPVRDADALADAVAGLVGDAGLRAAMGRAGRALAAERFDQRCIIATTLEVYAALLGSPAVRARGARRRASVR